MVTFLIRAVSHVATRPRRVVSTSRWAMSASVSMSDGGDGEGQFSTGGTGTGVQTIVKERIKEITVVCRVCV